MRIKEEYKGKTLVVNDGILGELRIEVDKIKPSQRTWIMGMGFGYIFYSEKFTGIEEEKPKKTRTRKVKPQQDEEE
jgi:hypothetical protein